MGPGDSWKGWIVGMGCSSSYQSSPVRLSIPIELGFHLSNLSLAATVVTNLHGGETSGKSAGGEFPPPVTKNEGVILLICRLYVCLVLMSQAQYHIHTH